MSCKKIMVLMISAVMIALAGCSDQNDITIPAEVINTEIQTEVQSEIQTGENNEQVERAEYLKITPEEAKANLEADSTIILLDVRTPSEYDGGHIVNADLFTLDFIGDLAEDTFPDKNQTIYVYCRSGRRSEAAANVFLDLGYQKVYDLGGISNWPYETEK